MPGEPPWHPWHHAVYDDIDHWDDERVEDVYRRLSRDLRLGDRDGTDMAFNARLFTVAHELDVRGLDADAIAREVQAEADEKRDP